MHACEGGGGDEAPRRFPNPFPTFPVFRPICNFENANMFAFYSSNRCTTTRHQHRASSAKNVTQ